MRWLVALSVALLACSGGSKRELPPAPPRSSIAASVAPAPVPSTPPRPALAKWGASSVHFADLSEAQALLGRSDGFTRAMGELDRRARTGNGTDPGEPAFLTHAAAQARTWPAKTWERWQKAIVAVGAALDGLRVPLPDTILFITTSGAEEFGNPYTRANAIIIPERVVLEHQKPFGLIAHELFHILSRHAPERRDALYGMLGFERVGAVSHPPSSAPLRLTNPDAYENQHAIEVVGGDRTFLAVPLIRAKTRNVEHLMKSLDIFLLEVDPRGATVVDDSGSARVHSVLATTYNDRAAINTAYAIHPEEVLADNFALMLTRRSGETVNVDKPALLDDLEAAFEP